MSSIRPRGVGQSRRIPISSTTTSSTKAGTLRLWNSRNSCQKRFARASGHCVTGFRPLRKEWSRECSDASCAGSAFFFRQVDKLLDEQRALAQLRMQIHALIEFAKSGEHVEVMKVFMALVGRVHGHSVVEAAKLEISSARTDAQLWIGENEGDEHDG